MNLNCDNRWIFLDSVDVTSRTYGDADEARPTIGENTLGRFSKCRFQRLDSPHDCTWVSRSPRAGESSLVRSRGFSELVNVQSEVGDAKIYQVRQIANLIRRYNLKLEED